MNPSHRVIVALDFDFDSAAKAAKLVEQLGDSASFYKVGLQLLTAFSAVKGHVIPAKAGTHAGRGASCVFCGL